MYPRLFTLDHITIPTYGALVACAVIAALLLSTSLARRAGLNSDRIWTLGLLAILSAIISSKLLLIAASSNTLLSFPRLQLSLLALKSVGTPIALAATISILYARHQKLPLLRTMDIIAPAIALGQGIAAIGCLAAGCDYGLPTHAHWGLVFTSRFAARTTGVPLGVPLYPTQIMESVASLLTCAMLLALLARRHRDGEVMATGFFLYGIARFFIEFYRGDVERGSVFNGAFTLTQIFAMLMVALAGVLWSVASQPLEHPAHAS